MLLPPSTGRPETQDPDLIAGNSGAARENSNNGRDGFAQTLEQITGVPENSGRSEATESQDASQDIAGGLLAQLTEPDPAMADGRNFADLTVREAPAGDHDPAQISRDVPPQAVDADIAGSQEVPLPGQDNSDALLQSTPESDKTANLAAEANGRQTVPAAADGKALAAGPIPGEAARLLTQAGRSVTPDNSDGTPISREPGEAEQLADNGRDGAPRLIDEGWSGLQNSQKGQYAGDSKQATAIPESGGGFVVAVPSDTTKIDDPVTLPGLGGDAQAGRPAGLSAAIPAPQTLAGHIPAPPMQQIMVAIEKLTSGDRINLRLDPPDLGNVSIRLEIVDGTIKAVVAAERPDTVELLARHRSELGQMLADAGFDDVETRIDLAGRDLGRNGQDQASPDERPPNEVALDIPGSRQNWQSGQQRNESELNDGRLDIRV